MREAETDSGRDEAGQPEAEGRKSEETDLGELRAGGLCEDTDIQKGQAPKGHEGGAIGQSKIPQTIIKRICKEIL